MCKLKEMADTSALKDLIQISVKHIEEVAECRVANFNIVLETEDGHCLVSLAKERIYES